MLLLTQHLIDFFLDNEYYILHQTIYIYIYVYQNNIRLKNYSNRFRNN